MTAAIVGRVRGRAGSLSSQCALAVAIVVAPVLLALLAVGRGERDVAIETAAGDELAQLAAAANAMASQLRSEEFARDLSDAARRHLVAAISHDLRTPITSLRLLAEAVEDDMSTPRFAGPIWRGCAHTSTFSAT